MGISKNAGDTLRLFLGINLGFLIGAQGAFSEVWLQDALEPQRAW